MTVNHNRLWTTRTARGQMVNGVPTIVSRKTGQPLSNPYGVRAPNDLTFKNCVHDSTSRIARVVLYLTMCGLCGPTARTKKQIVCEGLGKTDVYTNDPRATHRGWASGFFSHAVSAGFLHATRKGRGLVYTLGRNAHLVNTI
jgi:hypothetical protein